MSDALVLFLPSGERPWRWLRIADDVVKARGEGMPELLESDAAPRIAVVPADAVTLHWAELPDRSAQQSLAAARLLVADASAAPIADLHVAVGREEEQTGRPIAVVSTVQMQHWFAMLATNGVDPAAVLPAPMLLPRPDEGYLSADLGGEQVVRGATAGFADEGPTTELITGGVVPTALSRDAVEAAIVAATASPALDLRQGIFARRRRFAIEWALVRRLGWLAAAILAVTLFITLVSILKYNLAATALDQRADVLARENLPRGETVNDAGRQLTERLSRLRGPGVGFSRTAAALFSAVRAVPGSELTTLAFDPNGDVRAGFSAPGEGQAVDVRNRVAEQGFSARLSTLEAANGRVSGTITVSVR